MAEDDRTQVSPPEPAKAENLEPQPIRTTRVNRRVLALVGIVAIVVLWSGVWVFSRASRRQSIAEPKPAEVAATSRFDEGQIARLERRAAPPKTNPPRFLAPRREVTVPQRPAPRSRPAPSRSKSRRQVLLESSYDADRVLSSFTKRGVYAGYLSGKKDTDSPGAPSLARDPQPFDTREPGSVRDQPLLADAGVGGTNDSFLSEVARTDSPSLHAAFEEPLSPYTVQEGWLIPAVLVTGINSDLPGQVLAMVRAPVYDSASGRFELLPSGTRILGTYDSGIAWGQKRLLVAWERLIFPDGRWIDIGAMPGADLAGMAGVRDRVNNHLVRTFGRALLVSAFTATAQLSQPQESQSFGEAASARQVVAAAVGQELNRTANAYLRRDLSVQPTLEIRPGYAFYVQLTADLVLPGPYRAGRSRGTEVARSRSKP